MPRTYCLELKLAGRPIVVVGGGKVAARKVSALVEAGAVVRVVSPVFTPQLLHRQDVTREDRAYSPDCLQGAQLVFACTNDRQVNAAVTAEAHRRGVWCNVADDPDACDFYVPATAHQGNLTISVSTNGIAPHLASVLRHRLASQFGYEWSILLEEVARARGILKSRVADPDLQRQIIETLCTEDSFELLNSRDRSIWRFWFERVVEDHLKDLRNSLGPL